jgi:hypothetical protein
MKSHKPLLSIFFTLVLTVSVLASASKSYAQTDQDWSTPVNLSLSGAASNPVMVIDSSGIFHVIWIDEIDGYKYSQSADGVTWSLAKTVKFPFSPKDPPPVLLADANGSIHVFWISSDQSLFYGQITPADFANPGQWKAISRLAGNVASFDVLSDIHGVLHLVYVRNSATDTDPAGVYYKQSIIGVGGWSSASKLYETEYFRSAKSNDVYVRVSSSNYPSDQKIFVTWDNRAQKRVFMAVSDDSGLTWNDAQQIKGPDDTGGIETPFNLTVAAFGKNVLLIWQAGEPGSSKCTVYSQWSDDGGVNWGDTMAVFGGRSECPSSTKIISRDDNYISVIFAGQVSPIMVAWNGREWSDVQTQTQLPSLSNPLTFDAILLGCRFDLVNKNRLYVTGCDQGNGGDVWFLSHTLEPVENWFSPSLIWGEPDVLSIKSNNPERISNFYSTPDDAGNIHAVWAQSPVEQGNDAGITIKYARWNNGQWTNPESVIPSLSGTPGQLLVTADPFDRLLLSWIDGHNGDLAFSWANLENANLPSEWEDVSSLPSPSQLINFSDAVVDGSGRIIYAYVVPINEERGIYIVQSIDNGKNWSKPVRAFDAVSASWERIERPRLVLDSDGTLHLIFIRDTVRNGQTVGLYYSRSVDGGTTWSDVQILSEGEIQWADIVSYGSKTIHVVWQEYDGLVFANISQASQDGGLTWGKQNNVTGVNQGATQVSLASDGRGLLHFVQLINKDSAESYNQKDVILQDWKWDGANWNLDLAKDVLIKGDGISYSLSAAIASNRFLAVFVPVEYTDSVTGTTSEILTFSRFLEDAVDGQQLLIPVVPSLVIESNGVEVPALMPTPIPDFSVLDDDNVSTSQFQRNIAGFILIIIGIGATVFLLMRRGTTKRKE